MPDSARGRTGRPPRTSRAQILDAARALIEREGSEKLTMRGLAAELGVRASTLYHHVQDREDLIVQLMNDHFERTLRTDLAEDPRERIVTGFVAIHESLTGAPWLAEALTTDGFLARLGNASLRVADAILDAAVELGRTEDEAVQLFRALWYYTVGEILVRARSGPERAERLEVRQAYFRELDPAEVPRLAAIGDRWPVLAEEDRYADGVAALVDGMLAR